MYFILDIVLLPGNNSLTLVQEFSDILWRNETSKKIKCVHILFFVAFIMYI